MSHVCTDPPCRISWSQSRGDHVALCDRAAASDDMERALEALLPLICTTDDIRLAARIMGGTSDAAEQYITRADHIDAAIAVASAALAAARGDAASEVGA